MKHNYALIPDHPQPIGKSIGPLVLLALGAWLLGVPVARGQDAQQFRLGLFSEEDPVKTSAFMADGGSVMIVTTGGQDVLWRGSADGSPLWSKAIPNGTGEAALFPRPDGGLYVADAPFSLFVDQAGELDSMYAQVNVRSLASDGTGLWSRNIRMGFTDYFYFEPIGMYFNISGTLREDGHLLVALHWPNDYQGILFLVLLDPSGNVVWSQEVMDAQFNGDEDVTWLPPGIGSQQLNWVSTSDGSCIAMLNNYTSPGLRLLKIDASGAVGWAKRFIYAGEMDGLEGRPARLSSGDVLITTSYSYHVPGVPGSTAQLLAFRLNGDGDLMAKDLYQHAYGGPTVALPDDGWATCSGTFSTTGYRMDLVQADASGEVVQGWRAATVENGDFTYGPRLRAFGLDGEGYRVGLAMNRVHTVLTTSDYSVGGTRVTELDPGCLFATHAYEHLPIPDSLVTEEPLPSAHSVPQVFSIADAAPLADATPLETTGLCELILAVTDIAEQAFTVVNTIGNASQPIRVNAPLDVRTFRFVTTTGLIVRVNARTAAGSVDLHLGGLAAGVYLLEAMDGQGRSIGRARIVVE